MRSDTGLFEELKYKGAVENLQPPKSRLIFFLGLSILLSTFAPLTIIAPAPIVLAILLFGIKPTMLGSVASAILLGALSYYKVMAPNGTISFAIAVVIALTIYRVIKNNIEPSKAVLVLGSMTLAIAFGIYGLAYNLIGFSLYEQILSQVNVFIEQINQSEEFASLVATGGSEAIALKDLIKDPAALAKTITGWVPSMLIVMVFLTYWASLYMTLRNSIVWRSKLNYRFDIRHLIYFKTPEWMIFPLIAGLGLAAGGDYVLGEDGMDYGLKILYAVGIFYFFQGYGVLQAFFTKMKMFGFMRMIATFALLTLAWRLIVLIGVFDNWFNFKAKIFNLNKEGDNQ